MLFIELRAASGAQLSGESLTRPAICLTNLSPSPAAKDNPTCNTSPCLRNRGLDKTTDTMGSATQTKIEAAVYSELPLKQIFYIYIHWECVPKTRKSARIANDKDFISQRVVSPTDDTSARPSQISFMLPCRVRTEDT